MGFWTWTLITTGTLVLAGWFNQRRHHSGRHADRRYLCERWAQRVKDWWAYQRARR